MTTRIRRVNEVIGRNLRRMRVERGLTLDFIASGGRAVDLKWNTARVIEMEKGASPIPLATMIMLCQILNLAEGFPKVALRDLFEDVEDSISLAPGLAVSPSTIRDALNGEPVDWVVPEVTIRPELKVPAKTRFPDVPAGVTMLQLSLMRAGATLADERAAKKLGLSLESFLARGFLLWGFTMSEQRDRVASSIRKKTGVEPTAQKLGRITRDLIAEVGEFDRANEVAHE